METGYKHKIVLDIETTGLNPWYGDIVTCICAKDILTEEKFSSCLEDEFILLFNFSEWLLRFDEDSTLLITANGRNFDIPFLCTRIFARASENNDGLLKYQFIMNILDFKQFDILNDITSRTISLNDISALLVNKQKLSNGLQAITWFKNKQFEKIRAYCWDDVLLTEECYFKIRELQTSRLNGVIL